MNSRKRIVFATCPDILCEWVGHPDEFAEHANEAHDEADWMEWDRHSDVTFEEACEAVREEDE